MAIDKKVYNRIKRRLISEIKKADENDKSSMHLLAIYEPYDENEKALVQIVSLNPSPPPEIWGEIFPNIAKEVYASTERVPIYMAIINKILYLRADIKDLNPDMIRNASAVGYFLVCLDVESGEVECRLYREDFSEEENSRKTLSLFNITELKTFMPGIMLLAFITTTLVEDAVNNKKNPLRNLNDARAVTTALNIAINEHGKTIVTRLDEDEEDNNEDMDASKLFTDN